MIVSPINIEELWAVSPVLAIIAVFVVLAVMLKRAGWISEKDPHEEGWRTDVQNRLKAHDEKHKAHDEKHEKHGSHLSRHDQDIAVLKDRWNR